MAHLEDKAKKLKKLEDQLNRKSKMLESTAHNKARSRTPNRSKPAYLNEFKQDNLIKTDKSNKTTNSADILKDTIKLNNNCTN